jgi:mannan endo-1,4-beta-mannosidase
VLIANASCRGAVFGAAALALGALGGCGTDSFAASAGPASGEPAKASLPAARPAALRAGPFVRVDGQHFSLEGRPLFVMGFNYWSAAADARTPEGRARVQRELDRLAALGVRVLRILALSEGPDGAPWRIAPSLQSAPGRFEPEGLAALDWLMGELTQRGLYGVFMLNNFWFWSGGMAQYLSWARGMSIPYPDLASGRGWDSYERFCVEFFSDTRARALFDGAVESIVTRYAASPAVFAWELANEPHAGGRAVEYRAWVDETARWVESLDENHLITTGSEGDSPSPGPNGLDVVLDHSSPAIDFVSFHLWPENWGWTRAAEPEAALEAGILRASRYIDEHVEKAARLGKPILLLETGLPRDGGSFDPASPVSRRDRYLEHVFQLTLASAERGGALAGAFPWAWSGETRPGRPGTIAAQHPLLGDPPHEPQGWYGIYASDTSTLELVSRYAARITAASR